MARRPAWGLLAVSVALILAACDRGTPPIQSQSWIGSTTSADASFPLTIATERGPTGTWTGSYTVNRTFPFTGEVDAVLSDGALDGVVVVSEACQFELAGSVAGDELTAAFTPTACPGGVGGTWSATLDASAPSAGARRPNADAATFDSAAAFDAASFH